LESAVRQGRQGLVDGKVAAVLRRTVLRSGEALVNELIRRAMLKKNISIGGSPPVDSRRRYETTTGRDKTDESSAEKMNLAADALGQADDPAFAAVALNALRQGTKSLLGSAWRTCHDLPTRDNSHRSVARLAAAALKLVLLDGPGEGRGLICRLSLVLRKRHPLANDYPTRFVVFHVCGSLGCNFSDSNGGNGLFYCFAQ